MNPHQEMLAQLGALSDDMNQLPTEIRDRMEDFENSLYKVFFVDQVNGAPGNGGTKESPFPDLQTAIIAFKKGQAGRIGLMSDVDWDFRLFGLYNQIAIIGYNDDATDVQDREILFSDNVGGNVNTIPGAGIAAGGFTFQNCNLTLSNNAINKAHFVAEGPMNIGFVNCELDGVNGATALVGNYKGNFSLASSGTPVDGMAGRYVVNKTAGSSIVPAESGGLVTPNINFDNVNG